jgi:integrase
LKTALGYGPEVTFHSIRKAVITMLERAGVPEGTVQDIVGHKRSSLMGSTYSGKIDARNTPRRARQISVF